jgi:REP element-mobilizing transposase RayT
MFGNVKENIMFLNSAGQMISDNWHILPTRFPNIEHDEYVVMPNHLHGIIIVGAPLVGALNNPTLGEIIGAFKSLTTNEYIRNVKTLDWPRFKGSLWQRNYYEHVIRDERDLDRVREYIVNNPALWSEDEYYAPWEDGWAI